MPKPPTCVGCLGEAWEGWVPPDGEGRSGVLLVFEAPGEEEARLGRPMVGRAGSILRRCLSQLGMTREEFWVGNCLACRPPNNKLSGTPYEHQVLDHCRPNLVGFIERVRPKVIVAGGAVAMRWVLGEEEPRS